MLRKVFNIVYTRFTVLMLPTFLRKGKLVAWLNAITAPVRIIYGEFSAKRNETLYNLAHNGQVCKLRKVLNDKFDSGPRRIRISSGSLYDREYIYTNGEAQSRYIGTMYLRPSSDYADTGFNFRVIVPIGFDLLGNIHQLKATIDFYKLASKTYIIQFDDK